MSKENTDALNKIFKIYLEYNITRKPDPSAKYYGQQYNHYKFLLKDYMTNGKHHHAANKHTHRYCQTAPNKPLFHMFSTKPRLDSIPHDKWCYYWFVAV